MNVFITGVSSGIGWGLAKYYLSQGHQVLGLSRRVPDDLLLMEGFKHLQCDLSNFNESSLKINQFLKGETTIDLAILNAGILGPIAEMKVQPISKLKEVMDINVWANKPVIDSLLSKVPTVLKVVAISSGAAVNGNIGWGGYSISKAALNMLIKLYASENNKTKFYAFAPGLVDTVMQDYLCGEELDDSKFPSAQILKAARNTPNMPTSEAAGEILANGMLSLDKLPSGSFVDIRKMQ